MKNGLADDFQPDFSMNRKFILGNTNLISET